MDATRASANNLIIPAMSLILGLTILHEDVSLISIAGAGVCHTGAWLIKPQVRLKPDTTYERI